MFKVGAHRVRPEAKEELGGAKGDITDGVEIVSCALVVL